MKGNFKRFSSFFKVGIVALAVAAIFNGLFLPAAEAGLRDRLRDAVNRLRGEPAKSNLTVEIKGADVRGDQIYLNYVVKNNGSVDTPWRVPIVVHISVNDERRADDSLPLLRKGSWSTRTKGVTPRFWKKENYIKIEVDPYDRVDEKNENDNVHYTSVKKDLYTDLYIKKIEFKEQTVTEGDEVIVDVQIENKGNVKSSNPKIELII
ncbi:MAG: hypothetical protein JSV34_07070, partial [Candidatus Omnitrophota bacterium]